MKPRRWGVLVLLSTTSTLVCCVLPFVLVTAGLGSTMAAIASNAPWLLWLSAHKGIAFGVPAIVLMIAAWSLFRPGRTCPTDSELAEACQRLDRFNRKALGIACLLFAIAVVVTFVMPMFV